MLQEQECVEHTVSLFQGWGLSARLCYNSGNSKKKGKKNRKSYPGIENIASGTNPGSVR